MSFGLLKKIYVIKLLKAVKLSVNFSYKYLFLRLKILLDVKKTLKN